MASPMEHTPVPDFSAAQELVLQPCKENYLGQSKVLAKRDVLCLNDLVFSPSVPTPDDRPILALNQLKLKEVCPTLLFLLPWILLVVVFSLTMGDPIQGSVDRLTL